MPITGSPSYPITDAPRVQLTDLWQLLGLRLATVVGETGLQVVSTCDVDQGELLFGMPVIPAEPAGKGDNASAYAVHRGKHNQMVVDTEQQQCELDNGVKIGEETVNTVRVVVH